MFRRPTHTQQCTRAVFRRLLSYCSRSLRPVYQITLLSNHHPYSAANDKVVRLWDLAKVTPSDPERPRMIADLQWHSNGIWSMDCIDEVIVTGSKGETESRG